MDLGTIIPAIVVSIALSVWTLISLKKKGTYSTVTLILVFIIEFIILVAIWIGVNYLLNIILPK